MHFIFFLRDLRFLGCGLVDEEEGLRFLGCGLVDEEEELRVLKSSV